uniref:Pco119340 n=1 Tax=Arundo donax TaxID=35708 RepID=A0A0A9D0U8_ARUDO
MRLVGLTGGIASGKSTVSNLFKDAGVPVVDADIVARDVVRKGTGGWKKIVKAFGNDVLLENGEIDRARLGQIVFSDPSKRQLLNRYSVTKFKYFIFFGSLFSMNAVLLVNLLMRLLLYTNY